MASSPGSRLCSLSRQIVTCQRCARLVDFRQHIAQAKVKRYRNWDYWGKPVPGFGDPSASLVVVGLAPAAHGANRTGRMFTGDRSGDLLYEVLYRTGYANGPQSFHREDGLKLKDCYITAIVRCAPPGNRPTREEKENCFPFLCRELALLRNCSVIVTLGQVAFDTILKWCRLEGLKVPLPRPKFAHGLRIDLPSGLTILASYHPSQQNTFTGRLNKHMLLSVFSQVKKITSRKKSFARRCRNA